MHFTWLQQVCWCKKVDPPSLFGLRADDNFWKDFLSFLQHRKGPVSSSDQLKWRDTITRRGGTKVDKFLQIKIDILLLPKLCRFRNIFSSRCWWQCGGLGSEPPEEFGNIMYIYIFFFQKLSHFIAQKLTKNFYRRKKSLWCHNVYGFYDVTKFQHSVTTSFFFALSLWRHFLCDRFVKIW